MSDRLINYAKISPLDPEQGIILGRFNFQGRKEIYDHVRRTYNFFYTNFVVPHITLYYLSERIEILGKIIVFFFKFDDLERVI